MWAVKCHLTHFKCSIKAEGSVEEKHQLEIQYLKYEIPCDHPHLTLTSHGGDVCANTWHCNFQYRFAVWQNEALPAVCQQAPPALIKISLEIVDMCEFLKHALIVGVIKFEEGPIPPVTDKMMQYVASVAQIMAVAFPLLMFLMTSSIFEVFVILAAHE